jgi:hypothetical protein
VRAWRGQARRKARAPELEERIRAALAVPGRPGVRVIARQFGVNPGPSSASASVALSRQARSPASGEVGREGCSRV